MEGILSYLTTFIIFVGTVALILLVALVFQKYVGKHKEVAIPEAVDYCWYRPAGPFLGYWILAPGSPGKKPDTQCPRDIIQCYHSPLLHNVGR